MVGLALAALTAAPFSWLLHRRVGTALTLLAAAGLAGALQACWFDAVREARTAQLGRGPVELRGRIVASRALRARSGTAAVALDLVLTEPAPPVAAFERVRVTIWSASRAWQVGEVVRGRVPTLRAPRGFCNDGDDGYARAMWRQGVVATASVGSDRGWSSAGTGPTWHDLPAVLERTRQAIARHLAHAVADSGARAVLAALIYGDQSEVPVELRRAYARTGTAHVLSVSGLHVAIVAMTSFALVRRLLARWSWLALRVLVVRLAAVAALLPATFYALLSGGAVATMRSLVMAGLVLGGLVLLRRADIWTALAAAALAVCVADPGVAREPSFQLSFAAVIGLVAAGRRWEAWRRTVGSRWLDPMHPLGRWLRPCAGAVVAALAAGVVTGPITAYHFGSVATLGVFANLIVVPLVGWAALLAGLAGAVLIPVWARAAELFLWLGGWCVSPANTFVAWLATVPGCGVDVALGSWLEVACLMAPLAALAVPAGVARRSLLAVSCLLAACWCGRAIVESTWPRLEVHFLDVGQGDAILSSLPRRSSTVLVDGGGLGGAVDPGERVVLPALRRAGVHGLDVIALTHPDFDHYGGLAAVARGLPVTEFWWSGRGSRNATFATLMQGLAARGVRQRAVGAGLAELRAGGATVRVLHPASAPQDASDNDASLVLFLTYGASRVLLTGDLQAAGEGALLHASSGLAGTVVKVPHHGSRTSSTRELVARTQPGLAIAQLGAGNRFHFPAAEVRERWRRGGARWLETGRTGEVLVRSDGQLETVATCRQDGADDPGDDAFGRTVEAGATPPRALLAAARASWRRALSIWLKRNESS